MRQRSLVVLALLFVGIRLLVPAFGFPGMQWDFGIHYAIINEILKGHFFPLLNSETETTHAVSLYLPIYHGLVLPHLLVALLTKFGLSISKGMLLLTDLSFVSLFLSGFSLCKDRFNKIFFLSIFTLIFSPLFFYATFMGWFSQIISLGIYAWGLYFIVKNNIKMGQIFFLVGMFAYPDGAMWSIPLFLYLDRKISVKNVVMIILFVALFGVHLSRLKLYGATESYTIILLILLILVLFLKKGRTYKTFDKIDLFAINYLLLVSFVLCLSMVLYFEATYYAMKNIIFGSLLLLFLSAKGEFYRRKALIGLVFICFIVSPDKNYWVGYKFIFNYFSPTAIISQQDHLVMIKYSNDLANEGVVVLPIQNDPKLNSKYFHDDVGGYYFARLLALNSYFGNTNIYGKGVRGEIIERLGGIKEVVKNYNNYNLTNIGEIKNILKRSQNNLYIIYQMDNNWEIVSNF